MSCSPATPPRHANLGLALTESGKLEEAAASLRQAIAIKPDYAKAYSNLGMVLQLLGRMPEALEAGQRATTISPRWPEGHNNLGNILRTLHRLEEAIAEYRTAIGLKSDYATAYHNLGEALARRGDIDAGIDSIRQAIAIRPDYLVAHQTLLFLLHYSDRYSQAQIFAEHLKWAAQFEAPLGDSVLTNENDRTPDRRLRIGYVSPDFRRHPVGYFMRPIFAHHDPERFEVFVYSDIIRGDSATDFFRTHAHTWRETYALSDEQLAEQIHADEIDILIDLTLHMAHSRLLAFARKPAPIQATYLGYAHTTGLAAMDYKITDAYLDPPGLSEAFHTERIVRLPETNFCCEPDPAAPQDVGELPAKGNGYITFVSSNTLMKINASVVETWCRILNEVEKLAPVDHRHRPGQRRHAGARARAVHRARHRARASGYRRPGRRRARLRRPGARRHCPGYLPLQRRHHHGQRSLDGPARCHPRGTVAHQPAGRELSVESENVRADRPLARGVRRPGQSPRGRSGQARLAPQNLARAHARLAHHGWAALRPRIGRAVSTDVGDVVRICPLPSCGRGRG